MKSTKPRLAPSTIACSFIAAWLCAIILCGPVAGQDEKAAAPSRIPQDVMCVVDSSRKADAKLSLNYLKGSVYFCNGEFAKAFAESRERKSNTYVAAANFQLFATGQYRQRACPLSGSQFKEEIQTEVGGRQVRFCCQNCKMQVDSLATREEKIETLFSRSRFTLGFGFQNPKSRISAADVPCLVTGTPCSPKHFVEFQSGKLYFASQQAMERYEKEPNKYLVAANWQLVISGQYQQSACPLSGSTMKPEHSVLVGDREIQFCCQNCVTQIEQLANGDTTDSPSARITNPPERIEYLFDRQHFRLGFEKIRN